MTTRSLAACCRRQLGDASLLLRCPPPRVPSAQSLVAGLHHRHPPPPKISPRTTALKLFPKASQAPAGTRLSPASLLRTASPAPVGRPSNPRARRTLWSCDQRRSVHLGVRQNTTALHPRRRLWQWPLSLFAARALMLSAGAGLRSCSKKTLVL